MVIVGLFQLDQVYDPNAPEDDMNERYEEMNRMREHVMNELDTDKNKLVSKEEFMKYTASQDFEKDQPWEVRIIVMKWELVLPVKFIQSIRNKQYGTKFRNINKKLEDLA